MVLHVRRTTFSASVGRLAPLLLGLLLGLSGVLTPAHAFHRFQAAARMRLVGQVTALLPATGSPSSFVLLEPNASETVWINPQTQLTGESAEANVEGLVRDDYAVVNARRFGGRWVAVKLSYDVDPILPLRAVSGTVVRLTLNGRHVNVKLDTGGSRWVTIGRLARFRLDGHLVDPAPILFKGEPIQLVINRTFDPWMALEIDVRSSP